MVYSKNVNCFLFRIPKAAAVTYLFKREVGESFMVSFLSVHVRHPSVIFVNTHYSSCCIFSLLGEENSC